MSRRRCCCCEEIVYPLCGTMDDVHVLFQEDEEGGTWTTDPGPPCVVIESSGAGRMIGGNDTSPYTIATAAFQNVQVGDKLSLMIRWSKDEDKETWLEFRYTRNAATVTLAWYLQGDEGETLLRDCTANPAVWPYPAIGNVGDTVTLMACSSPIPGSDPELLELFGKATTGYASVLFIWARPEEPIAITAGAPYYAGFSTVTPSHAVSVEYFSHQRVLPDNPACQCHRVCDCTDDEEGAITIYPPAKLLLTYVGYNESGEDDCTVLTGMTVELELVPCGQDVQWIGYSDDSGCFSDNSLNRVRYRLGCPSAVGSDPDWFSSAKDWQLVLEPENIYGGLHKICISNGFVVGDVTLYSIVPPSTCNPFMIVFEYGPGLVWNEPGMYQGFISPDSNCPDECAPCGNSLYPGYPDYYFHIHWRCIITASVT